MVRLCSETRSHWKSNIKAYRYGLRKGPNKEVINVCYPANSKVLQYINERKLYIPFNLKITIGNQFDLQEVIDFLHSVTNPNFLQFDKIIVPSKFYSHTPEFLVELFDALKGVKISET
jgi:hypothetical protein